MNNPFLLPPPKRAAQTEFGAEGNGCGETPTRRRFLRRTGAAAIASVVAWGALSQSTLADEEESSSWGIVCKQEPASGDWGEALLDVVGAHGANTAAGLVLGGHRYLALATSVTNYQHPQWGTRTIRAGSLGRGENYDWAKVCVAGAFAALTDAGGTVSTIILKPKHYVMMTLDEQGNITVSDSGNGHTDTQVAGGANITAISKIDVTGQGTKSVTLDVQWSLRWSGFQSGTLDAIRGFLHFGATLNNELVWQHSARFVFESHELKDLAAKAALYAQTRPPENIHTWTNENGLPEYESPPFGYYSNPSANPVISTFRARTALTQLVTNISTGAAVTSWEF